MSNWKTKLLTGALALSVLIPTASYAAGTINTNEAVSFKKAFAQHQSFNDGKAQEFDSKMLDMVAKYTPQSLEDWKNTIAERDQLMSKLREQAPQKQMPNLTDEQKAKVKAIFEDVKSGKITREQAEEEMKKLGLDKQFPKIQRPQLTDEQKAKVTAIQEDLKNGEITAEQAKEEFTKLGLDKQFPKIQRAQLTDEQKAKVTAIREDLKNGKITAEQAKEEMGKLGMDRGQGFKGDSRGIMGDFMTAVTANDETKIKELLPQMLEQLKVRNTELSAKLAASNK